MIWVVHFGIVTFLFILTNVFKRDKFFVVSSFIYSLFVFGQRWMTGTDFPNYLRYYLVDFQVREPSYYLLQRFLDVNNYYFGILIFVIFLITLYNNYRFIIKINKNVIIMLYLFLLSEIFFVQLSQIRQFIAVSFFINSFYHMYYNEKFKSVINFILALSFHSSVLFLLPFMFFRIRLDRIKILYLSILSGILPFLDVSLILNLPVFSRYSHYLDSVFNVDLSIFHYLRFYGLLFLVIFIIWYAEDFKYSKKEQLILNGLVFNLLLYGASFQFALFLRVSFYFKIFEIVFLTFYFKQVMYYSKQLVVIVIMLFYVGVYGGIVVTDPYDVTRYELRLLRLYDNRNRSELYQEIGNFYD